MAPAVQLTRIPTNEPTIQLTNSPASPFRTASPPTTLRDMPPIPPPREQGFTTSTPVPLYWVEYGDPAAPPILLLHGGPAASHEYLLPQMLALAEEHRLVTYDQRGGGRSRHDDDRAVIAWRDQVEDVARVAAELRVSPLTIVGYSWGGLLAMLYAVEAAAGGVQPPPARLALIDPAPITRPARQAFEQEFARRQAGPEVAALRAELAGVAACASATPRPTASARSS